MLANLAAHWAIGLPVGVLLCFALGWGVLGMWIGLSLGLIGVGLLLLRAWSLRVASPDARDAEHPGEMAPMGARESSPEHASPHPRPIEKTEDVFP